jgi:hypothetical protein
MKYSVHDTREEAEAELQRIEAYFNIPNASTSNYAFLEEVDGQWRFRVKESGPWKCDDVAANVVEVEEAVEVI